MELTAFKPGGRFEVLRVIAHGAMGVVHEAFDRQRNARVAVKVLYRVSADGILRLKNEFRAIQGIEHPNLVAPIELLEEDGRWLILMELIQGVDLLTYVRPDFRSADAYDSDSTLTMEEPRLAREPPPQQPRGGPQFDERRLRSALGQLVTGLTALHRAKRVHRDIKPSNVLVRPDGHVMILDFGLIAETDSSFSQEQMVGTAGYMAPEQVDVGVPTPAADWYSVGVVLYEALTGRRPWEGSVVHVLAQKRSAAPTPPSALARVPADLEALCLDLLDPDPAKRPGAGEIARRLGQSPTVTRREPADAREFVGRESELTVLRRAFDETATGLAGTVLVTGESGVGKTALVDEFLAQLRRDHPSAVVLRGRCYDNESVPYKALDGVIDSLSHFLRRLPAAEAAGLVPVRAVLLTQAFPVLGRVEAMAQAPRAPGIVDLQARRNRMSSALRDLLVRLCERYPVVVAIDNMQWADVDSIRLYRDLMTQPDAPPVLLVATLRGLAGTLPSAAEGKPLPGEIRSVHLLGLPPTEARMLALRLLSENEPANGAKADAIAVEASGHPLFIDALVRFAQSRGGSASAAIRFDEAVRAQVEQLPAPHRVLLEVIAVAGLPIAPEHARNASGIEPEEMVRATAALRASSLIEHAGARAAGAELDVYHDRVREAVLATLDPARRRQHHRALALAMASTGDPDTLAMHWLQAGERDEAARYARNAADQAMDAFAFARAARFYRMVLEIAPPTGSEATDLRTRLGDALTNTGRSAEAAQAYLEAAIEAPEAIAIGLRSRAAGQLLRSGRFEQGLSTLRDVLAEARLHLPDTLRGAFASSVLRRVQLRLRGYRFRERNASEIEARELMVVDTCWSAALALSIVDALRGTDFQARHLLLALRVGEPRRVLRGLALEGAYLATAGVKASARAAHMLTQAQALAEKLNEPYSIGFCRLGFGTAAYLQGKWPEALRLCAEAEQLLEENCTGAAWEIARARAYGLWSMSYLGEMADMNARVPDVLKAAEERGDLCEATNLRVAYTNIGWLALDQPDRARHEVVEAMRLWPADQLQLQHYYELLSLTQLDLYLGRGKLAFERVARDLPRFARSWLGRIQVLRVGMNFLRGRAALAAAAERHVGPVREVAEGAARSIASDGAPWGEGLASLLEGQLATLAGDAERAAPPLRRAIQQFEAASMRLHAAVARRRLGELARGDEGAALVAAADSWMVDRGVSSPERMAALYAPVTDLRFSARPPLPRRSSSGP